MIPVNIQLPPKLEGLFQPKQFKVMHGGRGGGKSHGVAQYLIVRALQSRRRILCVREIQKSLAESSKRVIEDYIKRLGLSSYFTITQKPDRGIICNLTGTTFSFSGLKDHTADSIKSFEGATDVWCEEAHSITAHSWNILIPTIVRTNGAEIIATFNPDQEADYVYERFVKRIDPDAWVCQINWRDNPWFNDAMNVERLKLKAINDDLYDTVWEGKCRSAAGLLFKRIWFQRFELGEEPKKLNKYISSDYAAGPDPDDPDADPDWTEHGVIGVDEDSEYWLVDWWSGQEDPSVWINEWLALVKKHKPLAAFEEKGVILRTLDASIDKAMKKAKTYVYRHAIASAGNKAARALGFAAQAATLIVHVPNTPWGEAVINQACAFNGQDGRVDDKVDVLSLFGRGLDEMRDAFPEPTEEERGVKPFTAKWLSSGDRPAAPAKRF